MLSLQSVNEMLLTSKYPWAKCVQSKFGGLIESTRGSLTHKWTVELDLIETSSKEEVIRDYYSQVGGQPNHIELNNASNLS